MSTLSVLSSASALVVALSAAWPVARESGDTPSAPKVTEVKATAHPSVTLVPAITRAEIEAHVRFLAADAQKGRVTGTAEAEACARYLADVFARQGLAPAGDDGTFLQRVPLVRTSETAPPELTFVDARGAKTVLVSRRDFAASAELRSTKELKLVVAHAAGELPKVADPSVAVFFDGSTGDRTQAFESAGLDMRGFGLILAPGTAKAPASVRAERSQTSIARQKGPSVSAPRAVRVNGEMLERLRAGTVKTVQFESHVVREDIVGSNVVAKIAGVGAPDHPEFASEAVVVTAHYDHLDVEHTGASAQGADQIWNGADDDASGTSAVLEIAGALAHGTPPARTIVFVLVTGEEVGLLGTNEYLDRPVVALAQTVANLNFEMIGRPDPSVGGAGKLWFTGFEKSNLGPAFAAARLDVKPDPYPNEHYFERSDNIAFVNRGVVGQTLSSYDNQGTYYHKPGDEADTLDFAHMEACSKTGLEAVRLVASGAIRPAWLEGQAPRRR